MAKKVMQKKPTMPAKKAQSLDKPIKNVTIGDDYIEVEFYQPSRTGYTYYRYDATNPGKEQVAMMKKMAKNKADLMTYINQEVRKMYASRW